MLGRGAAGPSRNPTGGSCLRAVQHCGRAGCSAQLTACHHLAMRNQALSDPANSAKARHRPPLGHPEYRLSLACHPHWMRSVLRDARNGRTAWLMRVFDPIERSLKQQRNDRFTEKLAARSHAQRLTLRPPAMPDKSFQIPWLASGKITPRGQARHVPPCESVVQYPATELRWLVRRLACSHQSTHITREIRNKVT